jgi:hypothetical protein
MQRERDMQLLEPKQTLQACIIDDALIDDA